VLAAGLAIQIVLEFASPPRRYWHNVGFGLLVASYVLVLAFCARNLVLRGMSIVLIGIACNALIIVLNQGMPVKYPPEWRNQTWTHATVKHHPQQPGEQLLILSDIIIVKHPWDTVLSYGDLILAVGLCDASFNTSRDPQRKRKKVRRALEAKAAAAPPLLPANGNGNAVPSARHSETPA
jgi:ABC-type Fe3+-siderophore transport system permease subunit